MEGCEDWKKVGIYIKLPHVIRKRAQTVAIWYTLESFYYVENVFQNI